jgi:uncharacterized protein YkwD
VDYGFFDHNDDLGGPFDRIAMVGVPYGTAGENLAEAVSPDDAEAALMSDPAHRQQIMDCTFTDVGLGIAQDASGMLYVTEDFIQRY